MKREVGRFARYLIRECSTYDLCFVRRLLVNVIAMIDHEEKQRLRKHESTSR